MKAPQPCHRVRQAGICGGPAPVVWPCAGDRWFQQELQGRREAEREGGQHAVGKGLGLSPWAATAPPVSMGGPHQGIAAAVLRKPECSHLAWRVST